LLLSDTIPRTVVLHGHPRTNQAKASSLRTALRETPPLGCLDITGTNKEWAKELVRALQHSPRKFANATVAIRQNSKTRTCTPLPTIFNTVLGAPALLSNLRELVLDSTLGAECELGRINSEGYVSPSLVTITIAGDSTSAIQFAWNHAFWGPNTRYVNVKAGHTPTIPRFAHMHKFIKSHTRFVEDGYQHSPSPEGGCSVDKAGCSPTKARNRVLLFDLKSPSLTHCLEVGKYTFGDRCVQIFHLLTNPTETPLGLDTIHPSHCLKHDAECTESLFVSLSSANATAWMEADESPQAIAEVIQLLPRVLLARVRKELLDMVRCTTSEVLLARICVRDRIPNTQLSWMQLNICGDTKYAIALDKWRARNTSQAYREEIMSSIRRATFPPRNNGALGIDVYPRGINILHGCIPATVRQDFPGTFLHALCTCTNTPECIADIAAELHTAGPNTAAVFYAAALDTTGGTSPVLLRAMTRWAPSPLTAWPANTVLFILHHLCCSLRPPPPSDTIYSHAPGPRPARTMWWTSGRRMQRQLAETQLRSPPRPASSGGGADSQPEPDIPRTLDIGPLCGETFQKTFYVLHALQAFVLPCLLAQNSPVAQHAVKTVDRLALQFYAAVKHNPPRPQPTDRLYHSDDARLRQIRRIIVRIYERYGTHLSLETN
jgi:hypothetical protein